MSLSEFTYSMHLEMYVHILSITKKLLVSLHFRKSKLIEKRFKMAEYSVVQKAINCNSVSHGTISRLRNNRSLIYIVLSAMLNYFGLYEIVGERDKESGRSKGGD